MGRRPAPGERVVIIEDVTTAGTSVRETFEMLRAGQKVSPMALIVAVDRQERGEGEKSAQAELREQFGLKTLSIVTLEEIVAHLHNRELEGKIHLDDAMLEKIQAYRARYGASE